MLSSAAVQHRLCSIRRKRRRHHVFRRRSLQSLHAPPQSLHLLLSLVRAWSLWEDCRRFYSCMMDPRVR
jgi:hypothetical protein